MTKALCKELTLGSKGTLPDGTSCDNVLVYDQP